MAETTMDDVEARRKKADVLELINQAKGLVKGGKKLPFSSQVLVSQESLLRLLEEMRLALPSDVRLASQVMQRREQIITQALVEARRIMAASAEELEAKAQQHSLVKMAEKRAEEILRQAESQVRLMLADAEKQMTEPPGWTTQLVSSTKSALGWIISPLRRRKKDEQGGEKG